MYCDVYSDPAALHSTIEFQSPNLYWSHLIPASACCAGSERNGTAGATRTASCGTTCPTTTWCSPRRAASTSSRAPSSSTARRRRRRQVSYLSPRRPTDSFIHSVWLWPVNAFTRSWSNSRSCFPCFRSAA
jgi:hypothetical protein